MYHDSLKRAISERGRFGLKLQPPCSEADLKLLERRSIVELGHSIPQPYRDFLLQMDGFVWNGLNIYASRRSPLVDHPTHNLEGFVEGNLLYRDFEPMSDFLVFAEDGDCLYTYWIPGSKYQVILTVGLSVMQSFDTFEELLDDGLKAHLLEK